MPKLVRLLLYPILLSAATFVGAAELRIDKIDFNEVDQAGVRDPWYEVALTFTLVRGDEGPSAVPRFADDVTVRLSLATPRDGSDRQQIVYYQASAEYATLEVGRHVSRFYLPPSIAKRDRIRREPYAFECEVLSGATVVERIASRNLENEQALASFRARVESETAKTSGVLRLQQESPFWQRDLENTPHPKVRIERTGP